MIMSAENYLTASKAFVMMQGIHAVFDRLMLEDFYPPIKSLVLCLQKSLKSRFGDIETNQPIGLCTYLDPRFKDHAFRDKDALATLKCELIEKVTELLEDDEVLPIQPEEETNLDSLSIWMEFDSKIHNICTPKSAAEKAVEEIEMYEKEAVIKRSSCPLQWWRQHKTIYPALYKLFINKCNIVVTSVPCERAFSKAGYVISDRRTRITSSKMTQIMFLNQCK
ncbi:hypothetical protein JYU34_010514 [Plutella xylostella]|uniref:HAT C-terminal dimerisation domain-containing protein n=1 Tax=Plutella xylostella TaxID=51655 RepID=A0ABQ7QJG2_PLUXY|nr:hypothetical protein JYU34_010514 [Plutella xylostella]